MRQRARRIRLRDQLLGWMDVPVSMSPVSSRTKGEPFRIAGALCISSISGMTCHAWKSSGV